jgi:hypothetical protein
MSDEPSESKALQVVKWITEKTIAGVPPLTSAELLAQEYLIDQSFPDHEKRIESLIILGNHEKLHFGLPDRFRRSDYIASYPARSLRGIVDHPGADVGGDRPNRRVRLDF